MRVVPVACTLFLTVSMGVAQTSTPITYANAAETRLAAAYIALGSATDLSLTLVGNKIDTSVSPAKVTPVGATIYYHSTTDSTGRPFIELNFSDYVSGNKLFEVVANGETLWSYRAVPRPTASVPYLGTYSAISYGTLAPAAQSATYSRDLLASLRQVSPAGGTSSYAIRLMTDLFSSPGAARYVSWMPGPIPPIEVDSPNLYQDPVTGLYADPATGNENPTPPSVITTPTSYVIYNNSPNRVISFEIVTDPTTNLDKLNRIYYTSIDLVGGHSITTFWTITPGTDITLANFTPYTGAQLQGWRSVVATQAVHG